jgi:hypothetical protein
MVAAYQQRKKKYWHSWVNQTPTTAAAEKLTDGGDNKKN